MARTAIKRTSPELASVQVVGRGVPGAKAHYLDLEVSLDGSQPRVWRRFLIQSTASFAELHRAILDSYGSVVDHGWEFRQPGRFSQPPIAGPLHRSAAPDGARIKLSQYFSGVPGDRCLYVHSGGRWQHEVMLRRVVTKVATFERSLVGGGQTFPPGPMSARFNFEQARQEFAK